MRLSNFNFEVAEAQTDNAKLFEAIYRLRYQVYVTEWGFEKPEDHPEGLEKDNYDRHSRHVFAYTAAVYNVIGTARIILPANSLLPIQENFNIDMTLFNNPNNKIAEISRLAISKDFRRRAIDRAIFNKDKTYKEDLAQHQESMASVEDERRKFEHELVRGIYLMIYRESIRLELTHWCAVMARGLYVILARWGIPFEKVGPEKEYHGIRAPYVLSLEKLETSLDKKNPDLLQQARHGFV
jgi:N-acyl amino acid synthase of PEP-CTERM/exosortase system